MSTNSEPKKKQVLDLKTAAGEQFKKKNYAKASQLYTEAIELDKANATLWANRAACRHNMKLYIGAAYDAAQAVKFDPTYAKAHARLALARDALDQPWLALQSWAQAVHLGSNTNALSESEAREKSIEATRIFRSTESQDSQKVYSDYELAMIKSIHAILCPPQKTVRVVGGEDGHSTPWEKAVDAQLDPKYLLSKDESCTQYLEIVNGMFVEGLEMMSGQMSDDHIDANIKNRDGPVIFSEISVIEKLSTAILIDNRVFRVPHGETKFSFREKILKQAIMEAELAGVHRWVHHDDIEKVKQEARQLLLREGWVGDGTWMSGLRSALNITIQYDAAFSSVLDQC
ncbi:Hsp90 cochaperone [Stygiomarasmius scandens]|uniref:Hsp90 cochaperone n=1 Tax=Marasmiellus scandens TaxID=2682957 RepID=A0ABR1JTP8_9AGAR